MNYKNLLKRLSWRYRSLTKKISPLNILRLDLFLLLQEEHKKRRDKNLFKIMVILFGESQYYLITIESWFCIQLTTCFSTMICVMSLLFRFVVHHRKEIWFTENFDQFFTIMATTNKASHLFRSITDPSWLIIMAIVLRFSWVLLHHLLINRIAQISLQVVIQKTWTRTRRKTKRLFKRFRRRKMWNTKKSSLSPIASKNRTSSKWI